MNIPAITMLIKWYITPFLQDLILMKKKKSLDHSLVAHQNRTLPVSNLWEVENSVVKGVNLQVMLPRSWWDYTESEECKRETL